MTRRRRIASLAAGLALVAPPRAFAQEDPRVVRARALFTAATEDEAGQRWKDALEKLREVDAVKDTAGIRFHMANCEDHLGQLAEARADFVKANELARSEGATDVVQLAPGRIEDLEGRVPRLTLEVPEDVRATVRVLLDGAPLDTASFDVQMFVDPGEHRIEATAPGRLPLSQTVTMTERHAVVFTVRLPPEHPAPAGAGAGAGAGASSSAGAGAGAGTPPPPPRAATPFPTAAVLTGAGAVALAAFGAVAFVEAGSAHDDNLGRCAATTMSCDDLRRPVQAWDATALGAWLGAAALATVSIVLFVSRPRAATVALHVSPASFGLGGTF